jgi:hypothetical protein
MMDVQFRCLDNDGRSLTVHIDRQILGGWSMPPIDVDGKQVRIFAGKNREATRERVQDEIRNSLIRMGAGDFEEVDPMTADNDFANQGRLR